MSERLQSKLASFVFVTREVEGETELLLQYRTDKVPYLRNHWDVASGHLELAEYEGLVGKRLETPLEAGTRELLEEHGLECDPSELELFGVYTHDSGDPKDRYTYYLFKIDKAFAFGEPKTNEPDKIAELMWWPIDRLPQPLTPTVAFGVKVIFDGGVSFERSY